MQREEALKILEENLSNDKLIKHCIAVGAIMKYLARFLGEDENRWEIIGLLHDVDYEKTKDNPKLHGLVAEEILRGKVDGDMMRTIKSHNFENNGILPEKKEDYALIASDSVSGLIIASALVMPHKKLEEVRVETVKKKFKQKDFARNCDRGRIQFCEKIGIPLEKFLEIALNALKEVHEELGL